MKLSLSVILPVLSFGLGLVPGCAQSSSDDDPAGVDSGAIRDGGVAHDAGTYHPGSNVDASGGGGGQTGGPDASVPSGNDAQAPFDAAPPDPVDATIPGSCNVDSDCLGTSPGSAADAGGAHACLPLPGSCTTFGLCAAVLSCDPSPQPVCGCDGATYASSCALLAAGIGLASVGACAEDAGRLGD